MENFTPNSSLIGGMLIGLSAAILILFNGKIMGISGIIGRSMFVFKDKSFWRVFFLIGIVFGALLFRIITQSRLQILIEASFLKLIVAGFLVGIGTNLGSGCTSGHGICGMARFSKRSIWATMIFMLSGIITVFVFKHFPGGVF